MKNDHCQFMDLFLDLGGNAALSDLVMEYATLKQKLTNLPSKCSEAEIESKKQKIHSLYRCYERTREFFNQSTVDCLIHQVNEHRHNANELLNGPRNKLTYLQYLHHVSKEDFLQELIGIKSRTKILHPIDHYLNNPEEILRIITWD